MYARFLAFVLVSAATLFAQRVMQTVGPENAFRPLISDSAVLDLREPRRDLQCIIRSIKPELGLDLRLHSGYELNIPIAELAGEGDELTIIFRVTADIPATDPVYLVQQVRVPAIATDAKGSLSLRGSFDLGEDKYHVDWLMRNRSERFCSAYWELSAILPPKEKHVTLSLAPGAVDQTQDPLNEVSTVERPERNDLLAARILVNCASQNGSAAKLRSRDITGLLSIVRHIAREPLIGRFSVVAFNIQQQQIIWRQDTAATIDSQGLRQALESLNLGTVDVKGLTQKGGAAQFLTSLINRELEKAGMDVVIFVGPKEEPGLTIPKSTLKQLRELDCPVFYMNYDLEAQFNPWQDAIGSLVNHWHGQQFTITTPRDLFTGWSQIMSLVAKSKFLDETSKTPAPP